MLSFCNRRVMYHKVIGNQCHFMITYSKLRCSFWSRILYPYL